MTPAFLHRWRGAALLAGALGTSAAPALRAADAALHFQSGPRQVALVELYTSEGCSSCPPAEAWLNRLGSRPGLWTEFVPVALHVNYWDHLGWRDPWAAREFTERQRAHAHAWRSDIVYTPGMVLNGREWQTWSRETGVPPGAGEAGLLTAHSADGTRWRIEFAPAAPRERVDVHVALLARGLVSDVRAGENRRRRLEHDFVALGLVTTAMQPGGARFHADVPLPAARINPAGGRAIAVWVTSAGGLVPLQALGGELPPAGP